MNEIPISNGILRNLSADNQWVEQAEVKRDPFDVLTDAGFGFGDVLTARREDIAIQLASIDDEIRTLEKRVEQHQYRQTHLRSALNGIDKCLSAIEGLRALAGLKT